MKFRFSVDDNIWFLRDLNKSSCRSIFENEYLKFFKYLHDTYNIKVQFNLFYATDGFNLSQMTDKYKQEWKDNSDWLKLSFHAYKEFPDKPYKYSGREELRRDCELIHNEIIRFAGIDSLNFYTTVHWAVATKEGCLGLKDCGIKGLVGLFDCPGLFYHLAPEVTEYLHKNPYYFDKETGLIFFNNELVINGVGLKDIRSILSEKIGKEFIEIMIHEQYFYKTYAHYQPDFKEKVISAVSFLIENGYKSVFLDEVAEKI